MRKRDEKKKTLVDESDLLDPEPPVDLEFERSLREVVNRLKLLVTNVERVDFQMEFFKSLRACKFIFQHKIALFYGPRYRAGRCGSLLLTAAECGADACRKSKSAPVKIRQLL